MEHDRVVEVFGTVLLLGGVMGYAKKSSRMSLIAGASSGAFFLFAATDLKAYLFACKILSSILCIVMTNRARNSGKFMPAGMVGLLSLGMMMYFFTK